MSKKGLSFVGPIGLLVLSGCGGGSGGTSAPVPVASYTVGGMVTGLAGSGLVIRNAGADLPISANGAFTFPALANGAAYSVSVTTQPANPSQACTVSNSSGALAGANVTNVAVACVTPTGTISGRVSDAASGAPLPGVAVSAGGTAGMTAADGTFTLASVPVASSIIVAFNKAGAVPQSRTLQNMTTAGALTVLNIPMVAVAATQTYDPTIARTITVPNSMAQVQLAADSLRTSSGAMPTGMVTASVTPIAPSSNLGVMPGNYVGVPTTGTAAPIESFGASDAHFVDASGNILNVASGMSSTVRIAVSSRTTGALPATMPLFYFDTAEGNWKQEGTATLQGTAPNQYYQGTVGHFSTWNADQVYNTITATGCVQDSAGARVAGATVVSEGKDYTGSASSVSDSNGNFTVSVKASSNAFLQATKGTQVSNALPLITTTANVTSSSCLVLTQAQLVVRLTWGAAPLDLDSHTLGANSDEHVYYVDQGTLTQRPYISLDVDDTQSFGPEVTTFSKIASSRRYRFYVHNYSNTFNPGQTGSPARVEVTNNGVQSVFTPPAGETNQTRYWNVFDLVTDAACQATVVPVQTFTIAEPTNPNVGIGATYCN